MKLTHLGWITTILTFIFIVLKLTGEITWSWFWVLAPALIHWGLWGLLMITVITLGALAERQR